jgi:Acetylornithine deacetylase/Succinyl-diaminopimelate desuccinylase and related deacylases
MPMKDLLETLRRNMPETISLLEAVVNMDSPTVDKPLVDRLVRYLGTRFQTLGGSVEYIPAERFGDHLVARFDGASKSRLLILGHTDTVFPAGEVGRRPFRIENDRATGPGVFDMKAGITLIWAALRASGPLPRPVTVLLTSDEEMGSPSSRELIEREAGAADAVLVLEPSLPGGGIKTSRKGVGRFTVMATGRAAHAGIDPSRGINAIEEIAHQIVLLQSMSDGARGTTVTVGVVQGGTRVNVVPAEAAVEIDVRITSNEEAARITELIRALRPRLPGATLHIRGGINRPPMERTSDTGRLFEIARKIGEELGIRIEEGSTGGASDGNFTAAMGIPTLDGLGPIGDGAHSLEEYVEIASLPERAALIAGLIRQI